MIEAGGVDLIEHVLHVGVEGVLQDGGVVVAFEGDAWTGVAGGRGLYCDGLLEEVDAGIERGAEIVETGL